MKFKKIEPKDAKFKKENLMSPWHYLNKKNICIGVIVAINRNLCNNPKIFDNILN